MPAHAEALSAACEPITHPMRVDLWRYVFSNASLRIAATQEMPFQPSERGCNYQNIRLEVRALQTGVWKYGIKRNSNARNEPETSDMISSGLRPFSRSVRVSYLESKLQVHLEGAPRDDSRKLYAPATNDSRLPLGTEPARRLRKAAYPKGEVLSAQAPESCRVVSTSSVRL